MLDSEEMRGEIERMKETDVLTEAIREFGKVRLRVRRGRGGGGSGGVCVPGAGAPRTLRDARGGRRGWGAAVVS